jgi:hypothetical protein
MKGSRVKGAIVDPFFALNPDVARKRQPGRLPRL